MAKRFPIYLIFGGITQLYASKILAVFPTPSISHQIVFRPLTQELARRGHDVTVITTDPAFSKGKSPENLTEIDVHDISYSTKRKENGKIPVDGTYGMDNQIKMFNSISMVFRQQLQSKQVNDIITNKTLHFDLILAEVCVRPVLIFSHIFKAPLIQISSFGLMMDTNIIVGAPNHPLLYPLVIRQKLYNLTLWEKISETYKHFKFAYLYSDLENKQDQMLKNIFGPETPSLSKLYNNVDMVFLNTHLLWNDNIPLPPNVMYMGGLQLMAPSKLPEDIQSFLDTSKIGVIYMSFGTNVRSSILPPMMIKMMMNVFSELPYDVIWKWDKDLPEKPPYIKIVKWSPQMDLLHHKNIKLFITQGGLQSTDEAIAAGVPLIALPIRADQWNNAQRYVHYGIGKQLEINTFTEKDFKNSILTVINDQSYRHNIIRLRTLIWDQPESPLERAIWWTEYVLRHGGAKHLRAPAANMSWAEYYELYLILLLFMCLFTIVSIMYVTMYYIKMSKNIKLKKQ